MTGEKLPSQAELMSEFADSVEKIFVLSEKTPVHFLFGLGILFIVSSIILKIFTKLTFGEFTALVICATILLVLASLIRLYQYKVWREIIREQQKLGGDLMRQEHRAALDRKKQESSKTPIDNKM